MWRCRDFPDIVRTSPDSTFYMLSGEPACFFKKIGSISERLNIFLPCLRIMQTIALFAIYQSIWGMSFGISHLTRIMDSKSLRNIL